MDVTQLSELELAHQLGLAVDAKLRELLTIIDEPCGEVLDADGTPLLDIVNTTGFAAARAVRAVDAHATSWAAAHPTKEDSDQFKARSKELDIVMWLAFAMWSNAKTNYALERKKQCESRMVRVRDIIAQMLAAGSSS
jgi:hypothetical protein